MDAEQKPVKQPGKRGRPRRTQPPTTGLARASRRSRETAPALPALPEHMIEGDEEHLTSFCHLLRWLIKHEQVEVARIAAGLDVTENTVYRWTSGTATPRQDKLQRFPDVLPEYRKELTRAINKTQPGLLEELQPDEIQEVPKDIYRRVNDLRATI